MFRKGDKVEAKYKGERGFIRAEITRAHSDGTYDVRFEGYHFRGTELIESENNVNPSNVQARGTQERQRAYLEAHGFEQLKAALKGPSAEDLLLKMIELDVRASSCPYHSRATGFYKGSKWGSCESRGRECSGHGSYGEYCSERKFLGPPESVGEFARLHCCKNVAQCVSLDDDPHTALVKWRKIINNRAWRTWLRVLVCGGSGVITPQHQNEKITILVQWFDKNPGLLRLVGGLITQYYNPATATAKSV